MCSIDLDPCSVWRETPRVARKPHLCDGCGQEIRPGDAYLVHFDIFEGEANNERACFVCWWVRQVFADAHGQSFAPSGLWTQLDECIQGERDNEWRESLAVVLRRFRTSKSGRVALMKKWAYRRERDARIAAAREARS